MKKGDFRLRAKRFFLTYASLLEGNYDYYELALKHYEEVFVMKRDDFRYVMSIENHEDGTPHLHVYLEFDSVQKIYSATKLDLTIQDKSYNMISHHGNYQAVKSQHSTISYIIKTGVDHCKTNKVLPVEGDKYYSSSTEHLHAILQQRGLRAATDTLYEMYPDLAISRGSTILSNLALAARYKYEKGREHKQLKHTLDDFIDIPKEIFSWIENPKQTLILYGPSGTGKTELAKAIVESMQMNWLFIRDLNGLKSLDPEYHEVVIFDDVTVQDFDRERLIHLFDTNNPSEIRVLYGIVVITEDIKRVFTTNNVLQFTQNDDALKRRTLRVEISNRLFKSNLPKIKEEQHPALWHRQSDSERDAQVSSFLTDNRNVIEATPVNSKLTTSTSSSPDDISSLGIAEARVSRSNTDKSDNISNVDKSETDVPKKRGRGRPKGSKNKKKK